MRLLLAFWLAFSYSLESLNSKVALNRIVELLTDWSTRISNRIVVSVDRETLLLVGLIEDELAMLWELLVAKILPAMLETAVFVSNKCIELLSLEVDDFLESEAL